MLSYRRMWPCGPRADDPVTQFYARMHKRSIQTNERANLAILERTRERSR